MPSYNRVILIGRLTRDPELKYTAGGLAVTKFAIAVDRKFKNQQGERQTDFFDCTAWRQKAEFVANYVAKGRLVAVEGSIEFNEATGQDGQKRRYTNIVCDNVETLDSVRGEGEGGAPMNGGMNAGGGNAAGGNAAGGNANRGQNAQPVDNGGGYYPDEDAAPAAPAAPTPRNNANARPQGGNQGGNGGGANAGGNSGGSNQSRGNAGSANAGDANAGGNRPTPAPAYPEDDFDDSDPFADQ